MYNMRQQTLYIYKNKKQRSKIVKKSILSILVTILIAIPFTFTACAKAYVFFDVQGGRPIPSISGNIEIEPYTTKEGYDFLGWYLDSDFSGEKVTFPYMPTEDIMPYAKWGRNELGEKLDMIDLIKTNGEVSDDGSCDWYTKSTYSSLAGVSNPTYSQLLNEVRYSISTIYSYDPSDDEFSVFVLYDYDRRQNECRVISFILSFSYGDFKKASALARISHYTGHSSTTAVGTNSYWVNNFTIINKTYLTMDIASFGEHEVYLGYSQESEISSIRSLIQNSYKEANERLAEINVAIK